MLIRLIRWIMDRIDDGYRDEKPFLNDEERERWREERRAVERRISVIKEAK